jgi:3-oxoacyl-[acyl-carrier protein] reductase
MPTAIVTGGAGSLGQAITRALIADGWQVVIADKNRQFIDEVMVEFGPTGKVTARQLDVTSHADVVHVFDAVAQEHGGIEGLVNCAGGAMALKVPKSSLVDSLPEHWDRFVAVNLHGTFSACWAVAPHMKKAGKGGIVSIASGAGMRGGPPSSRQTGAAVYAATKAGVIAFTQALAQELGPYGIRVNALAPGRNESRSKPLSAMLAMKAREEKAEAGSSRESPLGRYGTPSDIGAGVAYLLSERSPFVTGTCLDLTGGIRLH